MFLFLALRTYFLVEESYDPNTNVRTHSISSTIMQSLKLIKHVRYWRRERGILLLHVIVFDGSLDFRLLFK